MGPIIQAFFGFWHNGESSITSGPSRYCRTKSQVMCNSTKKSWQLYSVLVFINTSGILFEHPREYEYKHNTRWLWIRLQTYTRCLWLRVQPLHKMFVITSTTTTSRCLWIRVQQLLQDVCEYEYNNYPKMFVNTSTVLLRQMQLLKWRSIGGDYFNSIGIMFFRAKPYIYRRVLWCVRLGHWVDLLRGPISGASRVDLERIQEWPRTHLVPLGARTIELCQWTNNFLIFLKLGNLHMYEYCIWSYLLKISDYFSWIP